MAFPRQNKEVVLLLCAGFVATDAEYDLIDKYRMFEVATANVNFVGAEDLNGISAVIAAEGTEIPGMFAHLPHPDTLLETKQKAVSKVASNVGGKAPTFG